MGISLNLCLHHRRNALQTEKDFLKKCLRLEATFSSLSLFGFSYKTSGRGALFELLEYGYLKLIKIDLTSCFTFDSLLFIKTCKWSVSAERLASLASSE